MELRPMTKADYEAYLAIHNRTFPRRTRTMEELYQLDEGRDPNLAFGRWVAVEDDRLLGYAGYGQWSGETYGGWTQVNVVVDEAFRRRGIGTTLYERVREEAARHSPQILRADAYEDLPSGLPFAERLGFSDVFREGPSHLDLDAIDAEKFTSLLDRLNAEGIEFLSYDELRERDAGFADALFAACRDAWRDVPKEHDTELPREDWDAWMTAEPGLDFESSTVAVKAGAILGFCEVWSSPDGRPVYAGLAGVDRAARGCGIATAAYVRAIVTARDKGHPQMQTSSAVENVAMQTVYAKLGFVREPVWIQLEKRLVGDPGT